MFYRAALLGFLLAAGSQGQVVINEFLPIPNTNGSAQTTHQWVELTNKGSQPVPLAGWSLADRGGAAGGRVKNLPPVSLPAGGFLVVHIAAGQDQLQFGEDGAHVYTGDAAAFWNTTSDDIALYSPAGIQDYIAWAPDAGPYQAARAHSDAVAARIWIQDAYLHADLIQGEVYEKYRYFEAGDSVGRDHLATDNNLPRDFDTGGGKRSSGMSPGRANNLPIPLVTDPAGPPTRQAAPRAAELAEWTVMYYLMGENNLEKRISENLFEAWIGSDKHPTDQVNHVLLMDSFYTETPPGYFRAGSPYPPNRFFSEDFAKAATLRDFLQRAKAQYPARKYALVISSHGAGWKSIGPDEGTKGTRGFDSLYMSELYSALNGEFLELLVLDACMMANLEVAYQVRDVAHYMVASEDVIPAAGINYTKLAETLNQNPGWDGRKLGEYVTVTYMDKYVSDGKKRLTMSLIDLTKIREVAQAVDEWAQFLHRYMNLHNNREDPTDNLQFVVADASRNAKRFKDDNFVDLIDFAQLVLAAPEADCVHGPIPRVLAAVRGAVLTNRLGPDGTGANGLHIYLPKLRTHQTMNEQGDRFLEYDSYDLPYTRLLSGDTSLAAYAKNNYFLPLKVRDVETGQPFAVVDRIAGVNSEEELLGPLDFQNIASTDLRFVRDTFWDEFLDRFYHPVAEAHIPRDQPGVGVFPIGGGRCQNQIDFAIVNAGTSVKFTAIGSSDDEFVPSFGFWDQDAEVECAGTGGTCAFPTQVAPGAPADQATDNIDVDTAPGDSSIDDVDGRGITFDRLCPASGQNRFRVTLHVWDKDHTYAFHDTLPTAEYVHPQSDTDYGLVQCLESPATIGLSAQAPFTQILERILLDIAFVTATGVRIVGFPFTVRATNLTNVSVRDATESPSKDLGRAAVAQLSRFADVPVPPGATATAVTNKQGYATIDFTFGQLGPASLVIAAAGRPPITLNYNVVQRLAALADDFTINPPAGPLTVGQDYTLTVDVRRGGAPLPDAVLSFTNPPGSNGTAEMRNGTLFRTNFGSQSRTGATGRGNVTFRPIANGPVEIMVISGNIVKVVTMNATGGPARAADRIVPVTVPQFAQVNREVTVEWQVKALEAPVAGVSVQIEDQQGSIRRAAVSTVQTGADGIARFRFTPLAAEFVQLSATVAGVTAPSVVTIPVGPEPPPAAVGTAPAVTSLNHGASGSARLSPGSLFSVYGTNLATATQLTSSTPWPATMGSATVVINGIPAPLYYVSPTQINGQIPYETSAGEATAVILVAGHPAVTVRFPVVDANPGILLFNGNRAVVVNQDGAVNTPQTAAPGGSYGVLYFSGIGIPDQAVGTGEGAPSDPLARAKYPNSIRINGEPVQLLYFGLAPTYPALAQANFQFPSLPPGDYEMVVVVNGQESNKALISIK